MCHDHGATGGTYSDNATTAELSAPYRFTGNWDSKGSGCRHFRASSWLLPLAEQLYHGIAAAT